IPVRIGAEADEAGGAGDAQGLARPHRVGVWRSRRRYVAHDQGDAGDVAGGGGGGGPGGGGSPPRRTRGRGVGGGGARAGKTAGREGQAAWRGGLNRRGGHPQGGGGPVVGRQAKPGGGEGGPGMQGEAVVLGDKGRDGKVTVVALVAPTTSSAW